MSKKRPRSTSAAQLFPYYGNGDLFNDLKGEVRARLTRGARCLLALTCKGEWAYRAVFGKIPTILAAEGETRLLRKWRPVLGGTINPDDYHDKLLHEAIWYAQWPTVRWLVATGVCLPCSTCLFRATHFGLKDIRLYKLLLLQCHPLLPPFWYEPALLGGLLNGSEHSLPILQLLYNHHLLTDDGVFSRLSTINHSIHISAHPGIEKYFERLLACWRWIAARTPDCGLPLGIWFKLIHAMIEMHWTPEAIDRFCRTGLDDATIFDAILVPQTSGRYEDVPGLLDMMQRVAQRVMNKPVEDWVVLQIANGA